MIVAGSYPPIPVPATGATVDAVRRELIEGNQVKVVSPRPSAAHYAVPLVGILAGRRLERLRRLTGSERLVFILEPAVPFDPPGRSNAYTTGRAKLVAYLLSRSFRRFERTTLVIAGDPGVPDEALDILRQDANEVVEDRRVGESPTGVTTRGPLELRARDKARRLAGGLARRLRLR